MSSSNADSVIETIIASQGDLAAVLGVTATTTVEELKRRHKRIALLIHPDKCNNPKAASAFAVMQKAYQLALQFFESRPPTVSAPVATAPPAPRPTAPPPSAPPATTVNVQCPHCGHAFRASSLLLGQNIVCLSCACMMTIGAAAPPRAAPPPPPMSLPKFPQAQQAQQPPPPRAQPQTQQPLTRPPPMPPPVTPQPMAQPPPRGSYGDQPRAPPMPPPQGNTVPPPVQTVAPQPMARPPPMPPPMVKAPAPKPSLPNVVTAPAGVPRVALPVVVPYLPIVPAMRVAPPPTMRVAPPPTIAMPSLAQLMAEDDEGEDDADSPRVSPRGVGGASPQAPFGVHHGLKDRDPSERILFKCPWCQAMAAGEIGDLDLPTVCEKCGSSFLLTSTLVVMTMDQHGGNGDDTPQGGAAPKTMCACGSAVAGRCVFCDDDD